MAAKQGPRSIEEENSWPYVYAGKASYWFNSKNKKFLCQSGNGAIGKYYTRDEKGNFHEAG